tara:strand:+ start:22759 stop:22908 length:150 start_codon:yes stop_codon:yes gene_type:complete
MADNTNNTGWGVEMQKDEHIGTYSAFLTGSKVATVLVVGVLVLMAIFLL